MYLFFLQMSVFISACNLETLKNGDTLNKEELVHKRKIWCLSSLS
mgnify:CR=1 FL=1